MANKVDEKPVRQAPMRFTDSDLSLIKSIFAENDPVLKALRKMFFQVELDTIDVLSMKPIVQSEDAKRVIRKTYFPKIDLKAPSGQVIDLWLTIDTKEKDTEEVFLALKVRNRLMQLIEAGLKRLDGLNEYIVGGIVDYKPDFNMSDEDLYIEYMARNALITHTEHQLIQLALLAGQKEESPADVAKRRKQDSAK